MRYKPLIAMAACVASLHASSQASFLGNPFDVSPTLSNTQAPGVWYTDRYNPNTFQSAVFQGDNRLWHRIDAVDGVAPNATGPGRPGAYTGTFYNTQGRKYDLGNGINTSIGVKLYVGSDWATNRRRADIWATALDGTSAISAYPIIGIANVDATTLVCRVYSQDTDQNPGNGWTADWINISAKVPGGLTTNRWYSLEIRIKPGVFEYVIDGKVVFCDIATDGSVSFADAMLQGYNFNDPALALVNQSFGDSYDIYWDDFFASPIPKQGFPVDLNGSYRSTSSGPLNPLVGSASGIAVAATIPIGSGNVYERGGVNAVPENILNGSFTPFNDTSKLPSLLGFATVDGTTYEADLELSGTWKPFQWGQGVGNVPPFATGDTFGVGYINSFNSFGVQIVTTLGGQYRARISSTRIATGSIGVLETNGTPVSFPMGTTRVRVNGTVAGGLFSATVMPLDGPNAFTTYALGTTNGLNLDTNVPWALTYTSAGFVAGFETHEHVSAAANATVSSFTTDAVSNVMFSFADDPYVRSVDPLIYYRIGQANLLQLITGFQAFMNSGAGQTFASGLYLGPNSTFFPAVITAALDAAGASNLPSQINTTIAELRFTPGGAEVATGAGFRANTGAQTNLFAGGPPSYSDVLATTSGSNTVVIDNTLPTLTVPSLGGSAWISPNVVPGTLTISTTAADPGAQQSGLDGRPSGVITWGDASTTPVTSFSVAGNTFQATLPITTSTPNGTATLVMQVCDRAGNCTTQTINFNVSTVNITLTIRQKGVDINVLRAIDITVGGSGGGHVPITLRKLVDFNTFTIAPGVNSREGTAVITYQDLDAADGGAANSVNPASVLTLVYAKDPFFSLGDQEGLVGGGGNYSGVLTLLMGDLTNNNIVNVSDLAVWAANNGTAMSANTTVVQPPLPRQANVDGAGIVDLGDRNLILSSWLFVGETNSVGNFRPVPWKHRELTVNEIVAETGLDRRLVASMDFNHDRYVTLEEVVRWTKRR